MRHVFRVDGITPCTVNLFLIAAGRNNTSSNFQVTAAQHRLTCAVEFDVFCNFRLDCRCDRNLLRANSDELAPVDKSLRCSLKRIVYYYTFSRSAVNKKALDGLYLCQARKKLMYWKRLLISSYTICCICVIRSSNCMI